MARAASVWWVRFAVKMLNTGLVFLFPESRSFEARYRVLEAVYRRTNTILGLFFVHCIAQHVLFPVNACMMSAKNRTHRSLDLRGEIITLSKRATAVPFVRVLVPPPTRPFGSRQS